MSTESSPAARVRASDAEREEYARKVRDAVGEGRLGLDEGDQRLAQIYATRFRDELRPLVGDLPRDEPPPPARRTSYDARVGFARHVWFVVLVAIVLTTIWAATGATFFWPAIPLIFLAFGVLRHASWLGYSRRRRWYADHR